MKIKLHSPWSQYARICLLLAIGYGPLITFYQNYTSLEWLGEFMNEALSWVLILSAFDVLVILMAIRMVGKDTILSIIFIILALYPMWWGWRAWYEYGLGPSSNADQEPYISFFGFWFFGGGEEVVLFVFLPLIILYLYLRYKEKKSIRSG